MQEENAWREEFAKGWFKEMLGKSYMPINLAVYVWHLSEAGWGSRMIYLLYIDSLSEYKYLRAAA